MGRERAAVTRLWVRILVLWTMTTAVLIPQISTAEAALLGWLTLGFVSLLCLGGPLRVVRIAGAVSALGLFVASQTYPIWDPSLLQELDISLDATILGATCIAVAGLLSHIVGNRLTWPAGQPALDSPAPKRPAPTPPTVDLPAPAHPAPQREPSVDEISQMRLTSALEKVLHSWAPRSTSNGKSSVDLAEQLLTREIARSSRYGRVFSLALFEIGTGAQQDGDSDHLARQVEEVVARELRSADAVISLGANKLAAILPETPHEGALVMAQRVHRVVASECAVECRIGMAAYPSDADNKTELVEEAEAALEVARLANVPVAGRQFVAW
jgi:GGDEF domain-containing protein